MKAYKASYLNITYAHASSNHRSCANVVYTSSSITMLHTITENFPFGQKNALSFAKFD